MVIALSFFIILTPFLYVILVTSDLPFRRKVILGAVGFFVILLLPTIALTFSLVANR